MQVVPLKRLLDKRETEALLEAFSGLCRPSATLAIADAEGEWLTVYPCPPGERSLIERVRDTHTEATDKHALAQPLIVEDTLYGVLYSDPESGPLSHILHRVLIMLLQGALIRKALARETLDRYREINLLYRTHETIGAALELGHVIQGVLAESTRIIKAGGGSVLLSDDLTEQLVAYDSVDLDIEKMERSLMGRALSERVFQTGKPSILNDLHHYIRPPRADETQLSSLLSAPLKSSESVLGVITLGRTGDGGMFTAGDEKLLVALASQAGIAIANAKEIEAREHRLRQQIEALRIEINETKKHQEVVAITEAEFFQHLQRHAERMRSEFDL